MPPAEKPKDEATAPEEAIPAEVIPPAVAEVAETPDPALDRVTISHPDIKGAYGEVTRGGFNELWKSKGFSIVKDEDIDESWTRPSTSNQ